MSSALVVLFATCVAHAVATTPLESQREFGERRIDAVPLGKSSLPQSRGYRLPDLDGGIYSWPEAKVSFSPDGKWVAVGYVTPKLFALEAGRPPTLQHVFKDMDHSLDPIDGVPLMFSGDSKWLAMLVPAPDPSDPSCNAGEVRIYTLHADGPPTLHSKHSPNDGDLVDLRLSADSKWLLAQQEPEEDEDPTWLLFSFEEALQSGHRPLKVLQQFDNSFTVTFSGDSKWLANVQNGRAKVYALGAGSRPTLRATLEDAKDLAFSPDSNWLVVKDPHHRHHMSHAKLYTLDTLVAGGPPTLNSVISFRHSNTNDQDLPVFSGDSKWLAAGNGSTVLLYALEIGSSPKLMYNLSNAHCSDCPLFCRPIGFSSDGKWFASVFANKVNVYYFQPHSHPILRYTLPLLKSRGSDKNFLTTMFSGDSKWLASIQVNCNRTLDACVDQLVLNELETSPRHIVI